MRKKCFTVKESVNSKKKDFLQFLNISTKQKNRTAYQCAYKLTEFVANKKEIVFSKCINDFICLSLKYLIFLIVNKDNFPSNCLF